MTNLLARNLETDSDNDTEDDDDDLKANPQKPWLSELGRYLATVEAVPDNMDIVEWWGVSNLAVCNQILLSPDVHNQLNAHRYPTWASLARDYLAVMASSVSSERAFSSAGITLSKRRNRLKGDIVEALQCMKAIYNSDLLFREVKMASEVQKELDTQDVVDGDQQKFMSGLFSPYLPCSTHLQVIAPWKRTTRCCSNAAHAPLQWYLSPHSVRGTACDKSMREYI